MAEARLGHSVLQAVRVDDENALSYSPKLVSKDVPTSIRQAIPLTYHKFTHSSVARSLACGMLPLPPRLTVRTRYQISEIMQNAGSNHASFRWNPVYCYDVDPTLGSTAMPFFTEIMTLYRFYRTLKAKITVDFTNLETFPVTAYVCPVNFDPGVNPGAYQNYLSNPNSKSIQLGPVSANPKGVIHRSATTDGFAGARWAGVIDAYCSTSTSAPTNSWYFLAGIYAPSASVSGCYISATIDITFVAFEEASPSA